MAYHVYIIKSQTSGKYYIGHTEDVEKRLSQHNAGRTPSTKPGCPWTLVYVESLPDKSAAYQREMEIKNMKSRVFIENLISSAG